MIASAGERISDHQTAYQQFMSSYLSGMRFKDDAAKTAVHDKVKRALKGTNVKLGDQKILINKTVVCADGKEGKLTEITYNASSGGQIGKLTAVWNPECSSSS